MVKRDLYLEKICNFIDKDAIKIITGTRPVVNGGVRLITIELNRQRDQYGKSNKSGT